MLSAALLTRLGLTKERMVQDDGTVDALFFYQLLFPIHDTKKTVAGDPRLPFYFNVWDWSNNYATGELKMGRGGYGHDFTLATIAEFVRWDGVLVMDGACGGSRGAILRRFAGHEHSSTYNELIASSFSKTRFTSSK